MDLISTPEFRRFAPIQIQRQVLYFQLQKENLSILKLNRLSKEKQVNQEKFEESSMRQKLL